MKNICAVEDCEQPVTGNGLCRKHYMRLRRKGNTSDERSNAAKPCMRDGCDNPALSSGLCRSHRSRPDRYVTQELQVCDTCGITYVPERRGGRFCSRYCKERAAVLDGRNAKAVRKSYFKTKYGVDQAWIDEQSADGCHICHTFDWKGRHNVPCVDHCHETEVVRGVLCDLHNRGLGYFDHDPKLLEAAAAYLRKHGRT